MYKSVYNLYIKTDFYFCAEILIAVYYNHIQKVFISYEVRTSYS